MSLRTLFRSPEKATHTGRSEAMPAIENIYPMRQKPGKAAEKKKKKEANSHGAMENLREAQDISIFEVPDILKT